MARWPALNDKGCIISKEEVNNGSRDIKQEKGVIDELQVPLMNAVLLYSKEGTTTPFRRPDLVDKIQHYYLTRLHRYLKYKYGENEAMARLARGMKVASMAREAQEIWSHRLPV